jgi:hypothetical protein
MFDQQPYHLHVARHARETQGSALGRIYGIHAFSTRHLGPGSIPYHILHRVVLEQRLGHLDLVGKGCLHEWSASPVRKLLVE